MKKLLLFIVVLGFVLPLNAQKISKKIKIMDIPVDYDAEKYNSVTEISYKQMKNDVEEFCYLVETSYAGFDDAVQKGLDVRQVKKKIINSYKKNQPVNVDDLANRIYEQFSPYIKDYHAFVGKSEIRNFITPTLTYFSNTYVTKENEKLYVFKSDDKNLQVGDEISCKDECLFCYPAEGENVYRLGCLSDKNDLNIVVDKAGSLIELPVFAIEMDIPGFEYYTLQNENSIYIRYAQCYYETDEELSDLVAFSNAAALCRDKENVILDVRGNPGGDDNYSNKFFVDLCFGPDGYFYSNNGVDVSDLFEGEIPIMYNTVLSYMSMKAFVQTIKMFVNVENDAWRNSLIAIEEMEKVQQKNPQKIIYKVPLQEMNTEEPLYKGKVIVITDNAVCSSGESIIEQAYTLFGNSKQFIHIGANTAGCGAYGNVCYYYLSNSGIAVCLGITDFTGTQKVVPSFQGEGKGYNPDYWCTNKDIADTLFYITQDEEIKDLVPNY